MSSISIPVEISLRQDVGRDIAGSKIVTSRSFWIYDIFERALVSNEETWGAGSLPTSRPPTPGNNHEGV
jgi:hypothetical protein